MKAIQHNKTTGLASTKATCELFGIHRDAHYKYLKRFNKKQAQHSLIIEFVKQERSVQPRIGTRKLIKTIKDPLSKKGIKFGRDALFNLLRERKMLIRRKKPNHKTTDSFHRFYKYNNLIKDLEIIKPNQVWVSDITYIRTVKGFCYLALITDLYSRKIIGYDISDSLELKGCLRALQKAQRQSRIKSGTIHHSDRGIQYCSNLYVKALKQKNMLISMTEENHCYENAVAERVNGILKGEFYLDECFTNLEHAKRAVKNAIKIYNNKRMHLSLNFNTPDMVHNLNLN
jgi:transposase InsO family protein